MTHNKRKQIRFDKIVSVLLSFIILIQAFCIDSIVVSASENKAADVTLLFTTDIHSNVIPHLAWMGEGGDRVGGFARLKTAIDENYVDGSTLLLDSGDFSIGTLYQNFTVSDALELSLMEEMNYDAVALGNHDFDIGEDELRKEIGLLYEKGADLEVLCSNLTMDEDKIATDKTDNPMADCGVKNYTVLERSGVKIGIFALMGVEAEAYTKTETMTFSDPVASAKAMVKTLREQEKVDLVVALSHSGIVPGGYDEDKEIAEAVDGIDVILSGHCHVALEEAVVANDTIIVCAGTALNYLGKLELTRKGDKWDFDYRLLTLDEGYAADEKINELIAPFTDKINEDYLKKYGGGTKLQDEFAYSPYDFRDAEVMGNAVENYPYAGLLADAYLEALHDLGHEEVQISVVPVGTVRGGLYKGELQVMDVFNVLSYGSSPIDGSAGSPVVTCLVTGKELYDICETSISLSGMMTAIQMFFGGLRYTYNDARPIMNKVYQVEIFDEAANCYVTVERNEETLYTIAGSLTTLESISLMKDKSFGLLEVMPKDEAGNALNTEQKLQDRTLMAEDGSHELKEWYLLYHYIETMDKNEEGLSVIAAEYNEPATFMVETDKTVATFFTNTSKTGFLIYGIVSGVIILIMLGIFFGWMRRKRRSQKSDA